jgi:hypothetical protein
LSVDLRGRGKSDGERFYVESFADYASDAGGLVSLALALRGSGSRQLLQRGHHRSSTFGM